MNARQNNRLRLVPAPSEPARLLTRGLVALYKAVKGAGFYPPGHQYRIEPLQRAWQSLRRAAEPRELVLTVNRQGFAPAMEEPEGRPMLLQLANECRVRRIATITFLPDLLLQDLALFVDLLNADANETVALGGFARRLENGGVRTVWINETDIAAIWAKRAAREQGASGDAGEGGGAPAPAEIAEELDADELLAEMAAENDDARYQELGRRLLETLRRGGEQARVLPVLQELLRQHEEPLRSLPQREYALFTLERLADGAAGMLMQAVESRERSEKGDLYRLLAALGAKAVYWLIPRLCLAKSLYERKALARALVCVGRPAVVPVTEMLKDERWYVVRNMTAILGELGAADSLIQLKRVLYHEDLRVRKEGIRAVMKISGDLAESMLISLLEEPDPVVVRLSIASLGLARSRQAVPVLLKLLERRDLFLTGLELKKELLAALGRIGDRRATAPLVRLLERRGLPGVGRWLELRVAVASALGGLRDEAALPPLLRYAAVTGALGDACREAVEAIECVSGGAE